VQKGGNTLGKLSWKEVQELTACLVFPDAVRWYNGWICGEIVYEDLNAGMIYLLTYLRGSGFERLFSCSRRSIRRWTSKTSSGIVVMWIHSYFYRRSIPSRNTQLSIEGQSLAMGKALK